MTTQTRQIEVVQQGSIYVARRETADGRGYEYMADGAFGRPCLGVRRGEAREYSTESEARQAIGWWASTPSYPQMLRSETRRLERQAHPASLVDLSHDPGVTLSDRIAARLGVVR